VTKLDPLQDGISSVEYADHMGSDLSVVNAARVSFDKTSNWEQSCGEPGTQLTNCLSQKDAKLVKYLADHNHWTPFGHTAITLRVKAPIFIARQLVKHQVGLVWNEVSRRYVDSNVEFYFPKKLNSRAENLKQGSTGEASEHSHFYLESMRESCSQLGERYTQMLKNGIAPEDARMFLPLNMYTEWLWTGSVAAWSRVCNLRRHQSTQEQTRFYGEAFYEVVSEYFPESMQAMSKQ
jgi:thymidylate synthase (FAD)